MIHVPSARLAKDKNPRILQGQNYQKNLLSDRHMEQAKTTQSNTNSYGHNQLEELTKSFNHKHNSMSVIVGKSEKISTAIYMVTDFVPADEPIRQELRNLSLNLIGRTRKIAHKSTEPDYNSVEDLKEGIEHTLVLIRLASTIGIISEMNSKIITVELEKIRSEIDQLYGAPRSHTVRHPGYGSVVLKHEMFAVDSSDKKTLENPYKGHDELKGQNILSNVLYNRPQINSKNSYGQVTPKSEVLAKSLRRDDVLAVVRKKGRVSVKDVVSELSDIGEKTIQRELLSLVKEGVLKKEGEKRWSTYTESIEYL